MSKKILHKPYPKKDPYGALSMPVYHSAAYEFDSAEDMELAFQGKTSEHVYSRITNPTVQHFEDQIREITGAYNVTALNSGMAAITNTLFTVARAGSNILTTRNLFGNTYSFLNNTIAEFGVETRFCDLMNVDDIRKNIDKNTCCVFLEIISNPQLEVVDLQMISSICKEFGIPLIADTTIIPFGYFKAADFGVDIEVVSSTKYISGGATSIGGLIVDYASFDWSKSIKLKSVAEQFGNAAFNFKLRKEIHRNLGAYMTPHAAYMQSLGLETVALRYEKATSTCLQLAQKLEGLKGISCVNHVGLASNPFYALSKAQFGELPGAMFTIDLESQAACYRFLNKLKVIKRATNLFDNKSLAIHPSSTIYGTFTQEAKDLIHIYDTTIRFSVGLESLDELYEDICQALD